MDGYRDLRQVLTALRAGRVDPARLAEVGLGWTPGAATPFWDYLVEHGVVAADAPNGALPATIAWQPPPAAEETPSFAADGATPSFQVPIDPARDTVSFGGPAASAVPAPSAARYEVVRPHRAGGLGEVWLARDTAVGREVALKTLRPERVGDPDLRARFVREGRITGQLEHPCVVPLYDLLPDVGGRGPCYAMRFVAGRTLAEAVHDYHMAGEKAGRLDLAALLDAFVAVCRAVAFAHARGVLHRDLKGQNVVLGDFGEVFLLDWGLAKPAGEADAPTPPPARPAAPDPDQPTRTGAVVGTPAYMAPEVAAGDPATRASDVYGLGAVLYTILTGKPPYEGQDPWEVVQKVKAFDPPLPRAVNPSAPAALEAVCRKAMARDPAGRYASADELATDVRRWLADEPVAAYRDPWTVRATRWARRHRTTVAAAAVFLLTALVALAASTALVWNEQQRTAAEERRAREEWARAEAERERAEKNFEVARGVSLSLSGQVQATETGLAAAQPADTDRRRAIDEAVAAFKRFADERPDDAGIRTELAQLYRYQANLARLTNDLAAAEAAYQNATRLWGELADDFPDVRRHRDELSHTLRDHAWLLKRVGRLGEAVAALDHSARLADALRREDPQSSAYRRTEGTVQLDRAAVEFNRGRATEAADAARAAGELFAGLADLPPAERLPADPLLAALAADLRGASQRELGRYDEALAAHDEAVRLVRPLAGPGAGRDARHVHNRVRAERGRTAAVVPGRRAEAVKDLGEAIDSWAGLVKEYPQTPLYREWLAVAYQVRGDLGAAAGDAAAVAAVKDYHASRELLEALVREFRDLPDYRGHLGRTCLGLARLAADPKQAEKWTRNATVMLEGALKRDPENALHKWALAELRAGPKR